MKDDFVVFILSHGRADRVDTYKQLRDDGYTGKIKVIIDDEDSERDKYIQNFGEDQIIIFNKEEYIKKSDTVDNFKKHEVILYARNAAFDIAKNLGIDYFLELDDDYNSFNFRYIEDNKLKQSEIKSLDAVFEAMIEFLKTSNALTVAFCQNGDFIGGAESMNFKSEVLRKAMNSFFCRTDRPINFIGTLNEDVNTYTLYGSRGELFFSFSNVSLHQRETQSNPGGLTETYLDLGTYFKSFYSVIVMPSAVKISMMGGGHSRIHHNIKWNNCVPKIINEKWKKK